MSKKIRAMVQDSHSHPEVQTARSLPEAASSDQSMEGYAAINDADSEVALLAHEFYRERQERGEPGSAVEDWLRAEQEIRRRRAGSDSH